MCPTPSKGDRPALSLPRNLSYETGQDEDHPGWQKLVLGFELARGSYATLLVKRLRRHSLIEGPASRLAVLLIDVASAVED